MPKPSPANIQSLLTKLRLAALARLPSETDKAYVAFKAYISLGPERTHAETRKVLGHKDPNTVRGWARKHDWDTRGQAYDDAVTQAEQQLVEKELEKRATRYGLTQDRVLDESSRLAFSQVTDLISWDAAGKATIRPSEELSDDERAAIGEISFKTNPQTGQVYIEKIKAHPKQPQIRNLGEFLKIWGQKEKTSADVALGSFAAMLELAKGGELNELTEAILGRKILEPDFEKIEDAHIVEEMDKPEAGSERRTVPDVGMISGKDRKGNPKLQEVIAEEEERK